MRRLLRKEDRVQPKAAGHRTHDSHRKRERRDYLVLAILLALVLIANALVVL